MSEYMDYNQWLEQEINIYKRENKLLNEKLDNFNTIFNELDNKKNDILKWSYSLEKENKQLKQHILNLASENTRLQNELFTKQLNEDETDDYINRLKQELFNLYLKHYN